MRKTLFAAFLFALIGCREKPAEQPTAFEFEEGKNIAVLKDKKLEEASGLAASIKNPGYLWTHNDSGNPAQIFLIDEQLNILLTCKLVGATNRDWEDICVGPGPDSAKSYVYVGDIGDNTAKYQYKIIYRFEEPEMKANVKNVNIKNYDKIVFQLPDKKKDAEALLINPATKDLFIISKREDPVVLYKLKYPYSADYRITAEYMGTIPVSEIVGGVFSNDGKEILLKNYHNVFYWAVGLNQPVEEVLKSKPKILPYKEEPQGEAITFALDGSGYYTLSEKTPGDKSHLFIYRRK